MSTSSPATVKARNVLAHYADADRNRAGSQLTCLVKDRSRDLGSNSFVLPKRLHDHELYRWRPALDSRVSSGHLFS